MVENQRDAGLARVVTTWGMAASIMNMVVGAGIFAVPAALAAAMGPYAAAAFLLCAIAIGAIAICFAEGGSRIATSGGAYGYIEAAFGPLAGYVAGSLLWFGNVLSSAGLAAAIADIVAGLLPKPFLGAIRVTTIVMVIGAIASVNVGGAVFGARLAKVLAGIKFVPIAIFVIAGGTVVHLSNFAPAAAASNSPQFGRALILALFAFTGLETPLAASGEVARPDRTIPRAIAAAMLPLTLLYVLIQLIAQGALGSSLRTSSAPLADAVAGVHPSLRILMLAGAVVSMFGTIGSDILGTPRVLFAFARDGTLPGVLGRVHPNTRAPYVAILCYAFIAIALAISGTFAELVVLATLATAGLYILSCAAAWAITRRGVAAAGPPLNFRWLGSAAVVGIVTMIILIALASRAEIISLIALVAVSAAIHAGVRRMRRPGLAAVTSAR